MAVTRALPVRRDRPVRVRIRGRAAECWVNEGFVIRLQRHEEQAAEFKRRMKNNREKQDALRASDKLPWNLLEVDDSSRRALVIG